MSMVSLTLDDVCELIVDCEHKTAPTQETGYPSIRTPNIGKGRLLLDDVNRVSEETYRLWTQRAIPKAGDLILAREAPVGNVAIIPGNLDVCLGQRTVLIRPNTVKVNNSYLVYLLLSDEIRGRLLSRSNGSTVGHLNMKEIRNLELPELPLLSTQERIADILSNYDRLIDNNTRRITLLEESIHRLYKEWFVYLRFPEWEKVAIVEGVPEGWELKKVKDFGTVTTGKTPSTKIPEHFGGSVPFIKTPDMHGNIFVISTEDSLTEMGANSQQKQYISAKAIMVACIGAKSGVVSLSSRTAQTNQQINSLIPNLEIFCYYCYYVLRELRTHLRAIGSNGATMINVNKNKFENMPVVLPLESLLKQFHQQASSVFEQILTLQIQNQKLREARDLLLSRLMNGSIAV